MVIHKIKQTTKAFEALFEYLIHYTTIQCAIPAKYLCCTSSSYTEAKIREEYRQFPKLVKENNKQGKK